MWEHGETCFRDDAVSGRLRCGRRGRPGIAAARLCASRSLKSAGANATLVPNDLEAFVRRLKANVEGDIDVAGPDLAASLTDLGLIDEYHLYFRPFVLGRGKPYFARALPPLRLIATDPVGEDAVRLAFAPASP
jgi:dihydrofolate reductase